NGVMRIVARESCRVRDERPRMRDREEQEQREAGDREGETRTEAHRRRASPGLDAAAPPAVRRRTRTCQARNAIGPMIKASHIAARALIASSSGLSSRRSTGGKMSKPEM